MSGHVSVREEKPREAKPREAKKKTAPIGACVCPESLSPHDHDRLMDWSSPKGFTIEQCDYAWERVRDWSLSKNLKRADWLATLRNAMTNGWALTGFVGSDGSLILNNRESAAEKRIRNTNDAARGALSILRKQYGLTGIEGCSQ
jgi:hypothetical protein